MSVKFRLNILPVVAVLRIACLPLCAAPDVTVIATKGEGTKTSVSISGIRGASATVKEFNAIVETDLKHSGWFVMSATPQAAAVAVSGEISNNASQFHVSVTVETLGGARKTAWSQSFAPEKLRDAAHALSDFITEKTVGKPGMASSKIIFVGRRGGEPDIYQCDADGARMRRITHDEKLCLSPEWFRKQNSFLYTSWISGSPAVYKINLDDNSRSLVASHPGMNQGATPSPDDSEMAIVLSRSGGIDLYLQNLADPRKLTRLTSGKNFTKASPSWSPNGKNLTFAGGENGASPTIYTMSPADKTPRRLFRSTSIREGTAPEWGAENLITFCGRTDRRYKIYTIKPDGSGITLVSPDDSADYEDPSWAPDGRHIVCTKTVNFKRSLVILDTKGDAPRSLITTSGDWYLPSWSKK